MSICRKHRGTPDFPGQNLNFCKFENGASSSTQLNVAWCEDSKSGFLLFWIVLVNELALVFLTAFNTEAGIIFYNKISARSNFLTVGFQKKHDWWNLISWSSRVQCCAQIFLTMRCVGRNLGRRCTSSLPLDWRMSWTVMSWATYNTSIKASHHVHQLAIRA